MHPKIKKIAILSCFVGFAVTALVTRFLVQTNTDKLVLSEKETESSISQMVYTNRPRVTQQVSGESLKEDSVGIGDESKTIKDSKPTSSSKLDLSATTQQDEENGAHAIPIRFAGVLTNTDQRLETGEFNDAYTFNIDNPAQISVEIAGTFNTRLMLAGPDAFLVESVNEISSNRSLIETEIETTGTYTVYATTIQPEETGEYGIEILVRKNKQEQKAVADSATTAMWKRIEVEELGVSLEVPSNWQTHFDEKQMSNGALIAISPHEGPDNEPDYRENVFIGFERKIQRALGIPTVHKLFEAGKRHLLKSGGTISNIADVSLGGKDCIRYQVELTVGEHELKTHQVSFVTPDGHGWTASLSVHPDAEDHEIIDDVRALVHMVTTLRPLDSNGTTTIRQANLAFAVPKGWVHHVDKAQDHVLMYGPGENLTVMGVNLERSSQGQSLKDFVNLAHTAQRQVGMPKPDSEQLIRIAGRDALQEDLRISEGSGFKNLRVARFITPQGAATALMTTVGKPNEIALQAWQEFLASISVD